MGRSPRGALIAAAVFASGAVLVWAIALRTAIGASIDQLTLAGFMGLGGPSSETLASAVAHLADPGPVAVLTAGIVALALARRRPLRALTVGAVLVGANVTTQALKVLTAEPRALVDPQSWPSGHATAAMTVALCVLIAAPPSLRPIAAALGAGFALAVAYSVLLLGWHFPSDVIGAFCVAAAWTAAGLAVLWAAERGAEHRAVRLRAALTPPLLVALGAAAVVGAAAVARLGTAFEYAEANTTFVAAAVAIGAGALSLVAALAAAVRD